MCDYFISDIMDDKEVELIGTEEVNKILKSDATKCKVCSTGEVVPVNRPELEDECFIVYTRDGTMTATHMEYRCNNRSLPCRAGHFYGYVTVGSRGQEQKLCYEKFALKKEFLVVTKQTAFSVTYLWDCVLQIVFQNASFESLAKVYNNLNFVNLPTDVMQRRIEIHRKRIAEAVILFMFLEQGQRYGV